MFTNWWCGYPMFDHKAFLTDNFKTPAELAGWLRAYGIDPPKGDTLYKWFYRGSVPSEWLGLLGSLLEVEHGGTPILSPYMRLPDAEKS